MSCPVEKHGEIIPKDTRSTISSRYHTMTRAINREFWKSDSETQNSLYVGSYGRGTAIDTSDLDILVELPVTPSRFASSSYVTLLLCILPMSSPVHFSGIVSPPF